MSIIEITRSNPFVENDLDRRLIWDLLVRRDFEAFVNCDWAMLEDCFCSYSFAGIDASGSFDPDQWKIKYPTIGHYRDEWLQQSYAFSKKRLVDSTLVDFLYDVCKLSDIEVTNGRAAAHKKFNGECRTIEGEVITLKFQTFYQLAQRSDDWKITGFVGYLPFSVESDDSQAMRPLTK